MYHFDFAVIQNYLVKSMVTRLEGILPGKAWCMVAALKAASTRTKNPGRPGFIVDA